MPVSFSDLFGKIGRLGGILNSTNAFRGVTVPTAVASLGASYAANLPSDIDGLYGSLGGFQTSPNSFLSYLSSLASRTVIDLINAEAPLATPSLNVALSQLIAEMRSAAQTVQANTLNIAVVPTVSNIGNAAVVATNKDASGRVLENAFGESITATVTADGQANGGAILGSEILRFAGQPAISDPLNWQYPGGSGAAVLINAVDGSLDNQGGFKNWLANGDFENFAGGANVPTAWHVGVGNPGTTITQGTVDYTGGAGCLNFVGNGSEQTSIYQMLGVDTTTRPVSLTRICVNLFARVDVLAAAGTLEVALVDGNGSTINDDAGTPNLFTQSLVGLSAWGRFAWGNGNWGTGIGKGAWGRFAWGRNPWGANIGMPYCPINGTFRLPTVLPSVVSLRLRLSTPLSSGSTLSIDQIAMAAPTDLYTGGPAFAVFSGSSDLIRGDSYTIQVSNNYAGKLQALFDRFFSMRTQGLVLPSSASPSIPDNFIA